MEKTERKVPKLRFPGFTDAWEQRKVSDVAEIVAGGTPRTGVNSYWEPKEVPWLSSGEVHKKIITYTDDMISQEGLSNSSAKMVKENSVLIALAGQGKTRGTVAINRIPLTTNQSIAAMTFDESIVPEFVFCNLENRYDEIRKMSSGDGSRGGLNKQLVGDIIIPYTSINEQNRIGDFFVNLENLITLHQRKCDEISEYKKGMLQKMFPKEGEAVPEIRFPGFTDDWEQRKIKNLSDKLCVGFVGTCEKYYTDEYNGIPMYRTGNIKNGILVEDDMKYVTREFHEKNKKSQLKKNDIVIARFGENGLGALYLKEEEANCLNCIILHVDSRMSPEFVKQYLSSDAFRKKALANTVGSTFSILNTKTLGNMDLPYTDIVEQNKIGEYLKSLDNLITLHQRKVTELQDYKKGLLQQMFI